MEAVSVRYGALWAVRAASLAVRRGEVVALLGENGAGKSTLLKALCGLAPLCAGAVRYGGAPVTPSPERAIAAGIGVVHQHFMLVPPLSVADNVVLGQEPCGPGPLRRFLRILDRKRASAEVRALSERHGLHIDPDRLVADLSVGEAQRVEILKVLYRGAQLLCLDEPTAVLTPAEAGRLLAVLRGFTKARDDARDKDAARGVLLVTHKLDEVMAVADRVVVMRRGEVVAEMPRAACTARDIARAMVGRELHPVSRGAPPAQAAGQAEGPAAEAGRAPALDVRGLCVEAGGRRAVRDLSLQVAAGEVLGIAGVEGNGQGELGAALAGLLPAAAGCIRIGGADVTTATVAARRRAGLALVPEDRHRHGLVLDFPLWENLLLGHEASYLRGAGLGLLSVIDRARLRARTRQVLAEYDVRPDDPEAAARGLSGGNQQKLIVGRELGEGAPRVLIAAQPTRGVDIGAVETIHRRLLAARDRGCAVLLLSAELDELRQLSDRIAVMRRGQIVAELPNPPEAPVTRERLGELMTGAEAA
jgi:simple sugar transport system ATP-binding protein